MRSPLFLLLALATGCAPRAAQQTREPFPGVRPAAAARPETPAHLAEAPARAGQQPARLSEAMAPYDPTAPAPPAPSEVANPRAFAARFPRSDLCEGAARSVQPLSRDKAWEVLKACVERGGFTLIKRLLDGGWDRELTGKSDASLLLAKVIAQRGGDVYGDLNQLRQRRVPLFGLGPAVTHPELYQGRLLLVRVRVDQMKTEKGRTSVTLSEFVLAGQTRYVEGDYRYTSSASAYGRSSAQASGEARSSEYGSASARGSYSDSYSAGGSYSSGYEVKRNDNTPVESGLVAVGRLSAPDPFFEPGRQFVVLARFDGVRDTPGQTEGAEVVRTPVLSIVQYVEPSPIIVE